MAIKSSYVLAPEPEKITKAKSSLTYGTPCINGYEMILDLLLRIYAKKEDVTGVLDVMKENLKTDINSEQVR